MTYSIATTNAGAGRLVPNKDREAINAAYRELLDALHGKLRRHREERRLSGYSASLSNLEGKGATLQSEHSRMQRHLDRLRSELQTYESNLTRLNISSKSGSSLLSEIERKRDALVADIHLTEQKIALLVEKEKAGRRGLCPFLLSLYSDSPGTP